MPIAGLRGTGDWGTDERPKNFRETILWRNPHGTAPILALTSKSGKRSTNDPEFAWWDEANDIWRGQVAGALVAADTLITIDSGDPTAVAAERARVYGKAGHLKEGDLLMVDPAADSATFNFEVIEVTQVISDTQFTVKRGRSGTTAGNIGNDAFLTLIGSAYAEGTGVPRATSRNPVKYTNYTQIFKDTYELTGTADETEARTGSAWSNDKKRKMWKHAADIEWALIFGRAHETVGDNGKPMRYMGGIRSMIGNTTVFGSAVTKSSWYDALGPIFDFDTGAGDSRIIFAGHAALMELQKIFDSEFTRQISHTTSVYGMNLTEFVMPHGRVYIKTHPLLSRHALWKKSALVLDFDAIKYVSMRNRDTKVKDDVQAKDEDVRRGFIQTECSMEVLYGGLTMAWLGNISAT